MEMIITYDVDTSTPAGARRLRRVAKACEAYGIRVQKSVFEVVCTEPDWLLLQKRLLDVIDDTQDSVRVYRLRSGDLERAQHLGHSPKAPHQSPLVY